MTELLDIFQYAFMQRAVLAGLMVALISALLGVFVVQRGLSFLGDGLAHSTFGGVALGLLLGLEQPLWIALPFTFFVALGIAWLRGHTRLSSDTAIGIFFAVSVALGVLFTSLQREYQADAWGWLFGSILGVGQDDIYVIAFVTLLCLGLFGWLWGQLAYATFDTELAKSDGLKVEGLEYLLFALAAVVVVASVKVVGVILVAAYLVIPAASARLLSRSLSQMTFLSVLVGLSSTLLGLVLSFFLDVPSGSTIILTQASVFTVAAFAGDRA